MKEVKKTPAKKAVAKAAPVQKPVAKAAPKAVAAAKPAAKKKPEISPEQRYKMIEQAAYFIAERHGFNGDSAYFWSLAEAEVGHRLS
ncbi:MAG: DUF2934 domain-containing protein [Opitutae bacterium]|nr:DUF2934 domain-containing protein [Opitutae bacterium]